MLITDQILRRFDAKGYELLDLEPVWQVLGRIPANYHGSELCMGQALQADYVLVGEVQNAPYPILELSLVMRETKSGHMVRGLSVEVRSKTDRSWGRGMRFILSRPF